MAIQLAALLLVLYGAVLALLWWGQERLLFHPEVLAADHRFALDVDVHERFIDVPGARLHALHLQLPAARGVVLYLHGNAGSLDGWFSHLEPFRRANFDLFMIDYRGYGKSSGAIASQAQLHADVRAAWDSIAARYAGRRRVWFGRSLGSALATQLAIDVPPDLTILVSPYTSLRALAAEHYPWVPSALLRYRLDNAALIARIASPVLLLHGEHDALIPPAHSRTLHELHPRAELRVIAGAGHNDLQEFDAYGAAIAQALAAIP
jgi:pimeloyl-ACP methyl ester carboxylesterase